MEVLIFLLVLVPIALVVLMVMTLGRVGGLYTELERTRDRMDELARALRNAARGEGAAPRPFKEHVPEPMDEAPPIITPPPAPVEEVPEPVAPPGEPGEITVERLRDLFPEEPVAQESRAPLAEARPVPPPPPPRPSFFERHPDLERFIGENLINKIGIAVLVIGIGLLMRYAIGRGLIGETGRTLIGLAAGGVLVFFAHRLRNGFRAFSSVLVAGGVAVFYSTIYIAYQQYDLIEPVPAFITMVLITGLAVALTLAYDRRELAVIALLGGFATPFLASTGEGNFRVLFTYLLILDGGMLVLANFKKWRVINILSLGLTLLVFGGWALDAYPGMEPRPTLTAFGFATTFFLVFLTMNLGYNLRHRLVFAPLDHGLLLANTAAYYGFGVHLLGHVVPKVTGLFTVLLGLFYLGFALYFHRRQGSPRALRLLLVGLVLTFVSLAAPVQLDGSHITLFWAAEAVLLLWFSQRSGLRLVERGSLVVLALMLVGLAMDLAGVYGWEGPATMAPLWNKGWTTGMFAVLSLAGMTVLLRRFPAGHEPVAAIGAHALARALAVMGVALLYLVNLLELRYQLAGVLDPEVVQMASIAFSLLYLLVLERASVSLPRSYATVVALLLAFTAALYITGFYVGSRTALTHLLLEQGGQGSVLVHYVSLALMVLVVVRLAILARRLIGRGLPGWDTYLWAMCVFLVVLASQELDHAVLLGARPDDGSSLAHALADGRRAGYPILWGVGSFLFMWYGMRQRMRMVRVIALALFAVTLLKLFLIDLRALSEGGRVAAFILLGGLLLVVSFMYQKLKALLQEDAPDDAPTDEEA